MTLGAGSLTKAIGSVGVDGVLRSTGTATAPAVVTVLSDDTIGGDSDAGSTATQNTPYRVDLHAGGVVLLDSAQVHQGTLTSSALSDTSTSTLTATNSEIIDSKVELNFFGGGASAATFTGNTFTRSSLYLANIAAPVLSGNTFADGAGFGSGLVPASPVYLVGIGDLAGIGANTATGTAAQQLFVIVNSSVRTSWTLQPGYVYGLSDITVLGGATMAATDGTSVESLGGLDVLDGGTLTAVGTTFGTWEGTPAGDITVRPGGTAAITLSDLSVPLTANLGFTGLQPAADVSVSLSTAVAITNLPKDLPGMTAVDGTGSSVGFASSHTHLCLPPAVPPAESPAADDRRVLWDVEGTVGRLDSPPCPPGYTESEGHP